MSQTVGRKELFSKKFRRSSGKLGRKVIRCDRDCWEDMIDLAENYYYQLSKRRIYLKDKVFGDRQVIFLCQSWYDMVAPYEWYIELYKDIYNNLCADVLFDVFIAISTIFRTKFDHHFNNVLVATFATSS